MSVLQKLTVERLRLTVDALDIAVSESLSEFELRDPDYTPTEREKFIARDFVEGLLVDEEFLRLVWCHYNERIIHRIAVGQCVDCGCPGGGHYSCCGTKRGRNRD